LQGLQNEKEAKEKTCVLIRQKERLLQELKMFDFIQKIYPSDANFILIKVDHATGLY
jgi:histidinol-phosphate aminotransferase